MRQIVLCVALVLTACSSQAGAPAGGVEGTVTSGPTCPVEVQGSPCPPQAWTGTVRATGSDGVVHDTETDAGGHYRLALEPGTYSIVAVVEAPGPPSAEPVSVTVGDTMQTLDLKVDSGIR
jgi:hypothetical protein